MLDNSRYVVYTTSMEMNYWFTTQQLEEIKKLYLSGLSAQEIKDKLEIPHTVRSVQRRLKSLGVIRTQAESFRLAVKKGRVTYHTNPNKTKRKTLSDKIRTQVYERDGFKCVRCGNTAQNDRLQIDHIDENKNNNVLDNLQVLCESCNKGKYYNLMIDRDKLDIGLKPIIGVPVGKAYKATYAKVIAGPKIEVSVLPKPQYPGKLCPKHHVSPMGHGWHQ